MPYGLAMENDDGITHGDSILRFLVPSRTASGETYLVDLGEKACQCRWHTTSVAPLLRRGEKPRRMCHHYEAARRAFTDWAIEVFHKQDQANAKKK